MKDKVLDTIINKYPHSKTKIKKLFHESDIFRSICEDYFECLQVIKRIEYLENINKKGYKKEYEELLEKLKWELFLSLKKQE